MITVDFNRLSIAREGETAEFKILDIGCGTGRHTAESAGYPNTLVFGVDLCLDDVAAARHRLLLHERLGEIRGLWSVFVGDIRHLPFGAADFDLVICSEVLEHFKDPGPAVREISRVLKPGGDLVVSVPRYLPERICWTLSEAYRTTPNGHSRIFKKRELKKSLADYGLKVWANHYCHSLHTPFWWLKCIVGPDREDCRLVNRYHDFLIWDIMKRPRVTRFLDTLLNPILGKSLVLYLRKLNR